MARISRVDGPKRATNLTLSERLIEEARALDVNLSRAAEDGIARAVKEAQDARWVEENRLAMADYDRFVEENGLVLEDLRLF
jgi:antitoxin CcdA